MVMPWELESGPWTVVMPWEFVSFNPFLVKLIQNQACWGTVLFQTTASYRIGLNCKNLLQPNCVADWVHINVHIFLVLLGFN